VIRRNTLVWLAVIASLCAWAKPAPAYFDRLVLSARNVGTGQSYVAVADDPAATVLNPAGLVQLRAFGFLSTYNRPYGVDGLNQGYVSAAQPFSFGSFGVSWYHIGLSGATSENLISVAFGRDLIRTTQDASLSVGVSLDLAIVDVQGQFAGSQTVVTGGVGVLFRPFPVVGLGYNMGNIVEGDFDFVPGGGNTELKRTHTIGLSYFWHNRVTASAETERGMDGVWHNRAGVEVTLSPNLYARGGVDGRYAGGGIGVWWKGVTVDVGYTSHQYLGGSYVLSVSYSPAKKGLPYAQVP